MRRPVVPRASLGKARNDPYLPTVKTFDAPVAESAQKPPVDVVESAPSEPEMTDPGQASIGLGHRNELVPANPPPPVADDNQASPAEEPNDLLWLDEPSSTTKPSRRRWFIGAALLAVNVGVLVTLITIPRNSTPESAAPAAPASVPSESAAAVPGTVSDAVQVPASSAVLFAATGSGVVASSDGATWSAVGNAPALTRLAAGNSQLVGIGSKNGGTYPDAVYTSDDGVAWVERFHVTDSRLADVAFDNGTWVVVATSVANSLTGIPGVQYTSGNGVDWTRTAFEIPVSSPVGLAISSLAVGNGQWLIGASDSDPLAAANGATARSVFAASTDGKSWRENLPVEFTTQTLFAWNGTEWGFVGRLAQDAAAGGNSAYSVGGKRSDVFLPGTVAPVSPANLLFTSLTWQPSSNSYLGIAETGDNDHLVYSSTDLVTWQPLPTPSGVRFIDIAVR